MEHNQNAGKITTSTSSFAIWMTLALGIVLAGMMRPSLAYGALGGDVTSVESDRAKMEASAQVTSKQLYAIHEMHAPNGVVVREFVSPAGKVFGVAWQGPTRPDLRQVLGTYFDAFTKAVQTQKVRTVGRAPLLIQQPGFVLQMGGHPRAFVGRAYVPQMVPTGVQAEELR